MGDPPKSWVSILELPSSGKFGVSSCQENSICVQERGATYRNHSAVESFRLEVGDLVRCPLQASDLLRAAHLHAPQVKTYHPVRTPGHRLFARDGW